MDINTERYELTWRGKSQARELAHSQVTCRMTPMLCAQQNGENIFIEGDNLNALKLLKDSYEKSINVIYIDPPYNTGKDFIYKDCFADGGCRHSKWLSMMYPRLVVARDLLCDDGVIFISIDESEVYNLRILCNEVFGEENFCATFIWTNTSTPPSLGRKVRGTVEYVLCYEKNKSARKFYGKPLDNGDAPLINTGNKIRELIFPTGTVNFTFLNNGMLKAGKYEKCEIVQDILITDGKNQHPAIIRGEFKWTQQKLGEEIISGTVFLVKSDKISLRFQRKSNADAYKAPKSFIDVELNKNIGVGTYETAVQELDGLGMKGCFDYAKPTSLIKVLLQMVMPPYQYNDGLVLDFFAGSCSTAHAVIEMNREDGGDRKFIMIQSADDLDVLYKSAGSRSKATIASAREFLSGIEKPLVLSEIGKERIRRAGARFTEYLAE